MGVITGYENTGIHDLLYVWLHSTNTLQQMRAAIEMRRFFGRMKTLQENTQDANKLGIPMTNTEIRK